LARIAEGGLRYVAQHANAARQHPSFSDHWSFAGIKLHEPFSFIADGLLWTVDATSDPPDELSIARGNAQTDIHWLALRAYTPSADPKRDPHKFQLTYEIAGEQAVNLYLDTRGAATDGVGQHAEFPEVDLHPSLVHYAHDRLHQHTVGTTALILASQT